MIVVLNIVVFSSIFFLALINFEFLDVLENADQLNVSMNEYLIKVVFSIFLTLNYYFFSKKFNFERFDIRFTLKVLLLAEMLWLLNLLYLYYSDMINYQNKSYFLLNGGLIFIVVILYSFVFNKDQIKNE